MPNYHDYGLSHPMGDKLRKEIERQLADDIRHYGVVDAGLKFDWSECVIEGHTARVLDGYMENFSSIKVFNAKDKLIAEGWMDYIFDKQHDLFIVYWDLLDLCIHGKMKQVKDFGVPEYIYSNLPDDIKIKCKKTHCFGNYRKAKVWISELPAVRFNPVERISFSVRVSGDRSPSITQAALELLLPGGHNCYVLLGVNFVPDDSGQMVVNVDVSRDNEKLFVQSLNASLDKVHAGIPKEYAVPVMEATKSYVISKAASCPSGILTYQIGAHAEVSSSPKMFESAANILMKIIFETQKLDGDKDINELLAGELDRRA